MSATPIIFAGKEFYLHGAGDSFDFLNDTVAPIPAGAPIILTDATNVIVAITHRTIPVGEVGSAHFQGKRTIYQAPFGGGANVAVGEILSLEAASGNLLKNTSGTGRWMALPKQGGGLAGASSAAASTDTAILVVEFAGGGGGAPAGSTITDTVSNGVTIRHDGSATPSAATGTNAITLTPNGTKILSVEFTGTASGGGSFTFTHNLSNKTPNLVAVLDSSGVYNNSAGATKTSGTVLTITGLNPSVAYQFHFDF